MNISKPVDYSAMFATLNALLAAELPQIKLYCAIGQLVSGRPEKVAAAAAAKHLCPSITAEKGPVDVLGLHFYLPK
ncbi:MAG: hypothetical protein HDT19_04455 [Oscillibacter sp.]|nr:hypothetical protein [Oscillibacter sp.]